jgi:exopolysaccharide biosynthesis polyprenyl glycosylphosphotransferase
MSVPVEETHPAAPTTPAVADGPTLVPPAVPVPVGWLQSLRGMSGPLLRPAVDILMLGAAAVAAEVGALAAGVHAPAYWSVLFAATVFALLQAAGSAERPPAAGEQVWHVMRAVALAALTVISIRLVSPSDPYLVPEMLRLAAFAGAFLLLGRFALSWSQLELVLQGRTRRPTLILGSGKFARVAAATMARRPQLGMAHVGFLDVADADEDDAPELLGGPADLERVVVELGIRDVVVTSCAMPYDELSRLVDRCQALGLRVSFLASPQGVTELLDDDDVPPFVTAPKRLRPGERDALLQGALLHDALSGGVNQRTLDILAKRRRTRVVKRRGWLVRRMLALADVLGIALAFLLAQWLISPTSPTAQQLDVATEYLLFLLTIPLWVLGAKLYGLYDSDEERTDHTTLDDVVPVVHLVTIGAWLVFASSWLTGLADPDIQKLALFWASAILLVTISRAIARSLCRRSLFYVQNTVIVGAGEVGQLVARKFVQHPEYGINVVGFVDDSPRDRDPELGDIGILGEPVRLAAIIRSYEIERVIVAFSNDSHEATLRLIRSVKDLDVQVDIVPRLFEVVGPSVGIHSVGGLPLVGLPPFQLSRSSRLLKRLTDVVLSAIGLLFLAPLFAVVAVAIKLSSPGPVFFRQTRMGANDREFKIFKFRTMVSGADAMKQQLAHLNKHAGNGDPRLFKIADDPRITSVGRVLRKYSLDELPQLINVLLGQMTLVGPRPLVLDEDQHVGEWARRRLDLKPGMTGPWQVLGRNDIPFGEMIKLDYLYVTNWSLWRDIKLLLQTVPAVLQSRKVVY